MMQVGDKLLCKNNIRIDGKTIPFKIAKFYKIAYFLQEDKNIILFDENTEEDGTYGLYNKRRNHKYFDKYYIWDYFYTLEESRKLKLEKINGKLEY